MPIVDGGVALSKSHPSRRPDPRQRADPPHGPVAPSPHSSGDASATRRLSEPITTVYDGGGHTQLQALTHELRSALSSCSSPELRRVSVEVERGKIRLMGTVASFYQKQLAQETIRPLTQGLEIDNQIAVRPLKG